MTPETKLTGLERPPAIGHEHRWTVGVAAPDGGLADRPHFVPIWSVEPDAGDSAK